MKKRFIYESTEGLRIVRESVTYQKATKSEPQAVSKIDTVTPEFSIEEDEE
jgi:hypothetical protein